MKVNIYSKEEIIDAYRDITLQTIKWVSEQQDDKFGTSIDDKWSTAEQLDHLIKSIRPLVMILNKPKFIIRFLFGKANRESRNYLAVTERYKSKLMNGGTASGRFIPKPYSPGDKKNLINKYSALSERLEKTLNGYTEKNLDKMILPHPLLGKLTIREMMFFTILHTRHHLNAMQELYG
jgi:DinB superfamily